MSESSVTNNKLIAKNTIFLYIRTFFVMIVSLFTSRVILNALGVSDYGIYDVVGGLVAMLSLLTNSLSTAISRNITVELGKGSGKLKEVFSASLTLQLLIIIVVLILAETIGVWFLNNKMSIPNGRQIAANWVLQFSILTFSINLINVPYNACIIAHEKMSAFAYISIVESLLKLGIAYLILLGSVDKLILYAALMALNALVIRFIYAVYCSRNFDECHFKICRNISQLRSIFSFAAWSFWGSTAYLLNTQGVSILSNMFFGVTINAARGITAQVEGVIRQFINNFTTALNPPIMKSYSAGNKPYSHEIASKGAKYSCYLILFIGIPIFFECDYILKLWLGTVPDYTPTFVRLSLLYVLFDSMGYPLYTTILASGRIKLYFIVTSAITLLGLPVTYLFYKLGFSPITPYVIMIIIYIAVLIVKIYLVDRLISFPIKKYASEVLLHCFCLIPLIIIPSLLVCYYLESGLLRLIAMVLINIVMVISVLFSLGMGKQERQRIINKIQLIVRNRLNNN